MVHFADDRITLFVQIAGNPIEIANRHTKCNVLCTACGILSEVVMEPALAGNRLDEFNEGTTVIMSEWSAIRLLRPCHDMS